MKNACLALLLLFALPATARAQSDVDALTLRDGAILRGHVAEIHPNQSITIVLITGEKRVVAWSDFVNGVGPSFPVDLTVVPPDAPPSQAPGPIVPPPPPPPSSQYYGVENGPEPLLQPGPGRVPLIIESATASTVHVSIPVGVINVYNYSITSNRRLCDSPCTLFVPSGRAFEFNSAANGISYDTQVDVPWRGVRVQMRTPSRARLLGGVWMLSGGLALGILGAGLIAIGGSQMHFNDMNMLVHEDDASWKTGGGILIGAGGGLLVGGIIMLSTNPRGIASRQDL